MIEIESIEERQFDYKVISISILKFDHVYHCNQSYQDNPRSLNVLNIVTSVNIKLNYQL